MRCSEHACPPIRRVGAPSICRAHSSLSRAESCRQTCHANIAAWGVWTCELGDLVRAISVCINITLCCVSEIGSVEEALAILMKHKQGGKKKAHKEKKAKKSKDKEKVKKERKKSKKDKRTSKGSSESD